MRRRWEDEKMWRWEDVKIRRCEDEKMWRWEDLKMRGCEDERMWRWEDVKMRRCEDEKMWRWEDVKMRGCEDKKMWRWEDVKMRRCEDEKMWRWEGVREGVKMRRCFTDPHYWKNPALRRSREKDLRHLETKFFRESPNWMCSSVLTADWIALPVSSQSGSSTQVACAEGSVNVVLLTCTGHLLVTGRIWNFFNGKL